MPKVSSGSTNAVPCHPILEVTLTFLGGSTSFKYCASLSRAFFSRDTVTPLFTRRCRTASGLATISAMSTISECSMPSLSLKRISFPHELLLISRVTAMISIREQIQSGGVILFSKLCLKKTPLSLIIKFLVSVMFSCLYCKQSIKGVVHPQGSLHFFVQSMSCTA